MGAPELLHHLRGAGLVLKLTPAGGLRVAPRTALTDDHRAAIRTERDALVLALDAEAQREAFEERAAIMEFDGGLTRADAEAAAFALHPWTDTGVAEISERRDREQDARVSCTDRRHYRLGRCANHRHAGLQSADVRRDLPALLHHCPGYAMAGGGDV